MTPSLFLALTLCVTAGAAAWRHVRLRHHRKALQALATAWRMHYSPKDRFGLVDGVVELLPVVGASDVRVMDLIYGNEADAYRYLLCVEFTVGVTYSKHCHARVMTFREGKSSSAADRGPRWTDVAFAEPRATRLSEYESLHASLMVGRAETTAG